jgi:hypothetical protein
MQRERERERQRKRERELSATTFHADAYQRKKETEREIVTGRDTCMGE